MLIGVDSVWDEVGSEFVFDARFRGDELAWERLLPRDDDMEDSALEVCDRVFCIPAELLGPVGGAADESNVFIMACSSSDHLRKLIVQSNSQKKAPSLCREGAP